MVNSACGVSAELRVVSSCPTFSRNFQLPLIMEQLSWLPGRQVALAGWLLLLHSPTEQGHPARKGRIGRKWFGEERNFWLAGYELVPGVTAPGCGCSLRCGVTCRICGAWGDCTAGVCVLPLLLAQFWNKTEGSALERGWKWGWKLLQEQCPWASSCCLTLLLVPALHSQASEGCRKDRKVSLASI